MDVSIRELKANLSHYLRLVTQGEHLVVTSHNRPLANISPFELNVDVGKRLLASPGIEWNGKRPSGGSRPPKVKGRRTVSDLVLEDRE